MDYELARQLKDGGFPSKYPIVLPTKEYKTHSYPKLEELIDACGSHFSNLIYGYLSGTFRAYGFSDLTEGRDDEVCSDWCKTPTEAMAKLWLELNKK